MLIRKLVSSIPAATMVSGTLWKKFIICLTTISLKQRYSVTERMKKLVRELHMTLLLTQVRKKITMVMTKLIMIPSMTGYWNLILQSAIT